MIRILNTFIAIGFTVLMISSVEASKRMRDEDDFAGNLKNTRVKLDDSKEKVLSAPEVGNRTNYFSHLPNEVIIYMMSHMDDRSVQAFGICDKRLRECSEFSFKQRTKCSFGVTDPFNIPGGSWKHTYFTLGNMASTLKTELEAPEGAKKRLGDNPVLGTFSFFTQLLCPFCPCRDFKNFKFNETIFEKYVQLYKSLGSTALTDYFLKILDKSHLQEYEKHSLFANVLKQEIENITHDTPEKVLESMIHAVEAVNYKSGSLNWLLGHFFQSSGQSSSAENQYKIAIDKAAGNDPWKLRSNYARCLYGQKKYDEAAEQYQIAIDKAAGNVRWQLRAKYAHCLLKQEKYDEAAEQYQIAIDKAAGNDSWQLRVNYARCLHAQNKYDEAENQYKIAIDKAAGNESWGLRENYADCLLNQKKYDEAAEQFQIAIDKAAGNDDWRVRANYGRCL